MMKRLWRGLVLALIAANAHAAYPEKPIRLIVPFATGGGADFTARVISESLSAKLGQPIVVENRPGAGGLIGATAVTRAEPDGYTLLYTTPGQQMTLPYLVKDMPYDPDALRPVAQVSLAPSVLVVNKQLGIKTLDELIQLAKQRPGELTYVSAGIGASSHLNGELLQRLAGIKLQHVPYKGTGDALKDLVGGDGDMAIDTVGIYTAFIKDGRLIPLGVTTPEEVPVLPGVMPISRSLPGYDASPVNYISVPRATPEDIVARLSRAIQETVAEPKVKEQMLTQGILAMSNTPAEMEELVRKEQARWRKVILEAGITPK